MRQHWKLVAFVALVVGAFFVGRFFGPEKVETRYEERVVVHVQIQTKTVIKTAETKVVFKDRWREKVTQPDGTVIERESEKEHSKTDTKTETATETKTDSQSERVVTAEKKVTLSPDWRLSARFGVDISTAARAQPQWIVGLQVDRRIIGGFSLGLWGQKQFTVNVLDGWAAGFAVSFDF